MLIRLKINYILLVHYDRQSYRITSNVIYMTPITVKEKSHSIKLITKTVILKVTSNYSFKINIVK